MTLLAIITQIALGNVCMMNVAYTTDISTSMSMHHGSMEMVMSPVIPMSPLHCISCIAVVIKQAPPFTIPCDNDHCVSHTSDTALIATPAYPLISIALPIAAHTLITKKYIAIPQTIYAAPPHSRLQTDTIVLLI